MPYSDEDLIEQAMNMPLTYCDGFGAYRKVNGVLRTIGFVLQGGANLNLACSLVGADDAQAATAKALRLKEPAKGITIWNGTNLAH
jgi:hypothetical protein